MNGVYTNLAKKRVEQSKESLTQGSVPPLSEKPHIQEADKQEKPANHQTRKPIKQSPADFDKVEKYTTHLEPSLIKKIKLAAIEKDMKDYDVVRAALKQYFENNQ